MSRFIRNDDLDELHRLWTEQIHRRTASSTSLLRHCSYSSAPPTRVSNLCSDFLLSSTNDIWITSHSKEGVAEFYFFLTASTLFTRLGFTILVISYFAPSVLFNYIYCFNIKFLYKNIYIIQQQRVFLKKKRAKNH